MDNILFYFRFICLVLGKFRKFPLISWIAIPTLLANCNHPRQFTAFQFPFHFISFVVAFPMQVQLLNTEKRHKFFPKALLLLQEKKSNWEKYQTKYQQRVTQNHQWWYPCKDSHISLPFRLQQIYDTFLLIYHGMQYKNKNGRNIYY